MAEADLATVGEVVDDDLRPAEGDLFGLALVGQGLGDVEVDVVVLGVPPGAQLGFASEQDDVVPTAEVDDVRWGEVVAADDLAGLRREADHEAAILWRAEGVPRDRVGGALVGERALEDEGGFLFGDGRGVGFEGEVLQVGGPQAFAIDEAVLLQPVRLLFEAADLREAGVLERDGDRGCAADAGGRHSVTVAHERVHRLHRRHQAVQAEDRQLRLTRAGHQAAAHRGAGVVLDRLQVIFEGGVDLLPQAAEAVVADEPLDAPALERLTQERRHAERCPLQLFGGVAVVDERPADEAAEASEVVREDGVVRGDRQVGRGADAADPAAGGRQVLVERPQHLAGDDHRLPEVHGVVAVVGVVREVAIEGCAAQVGTDEGLGLAVVVVLARQRQVHLWGDRHAEADVQAVLFAGDGRADAETLRRVAIADLLLGGGVRQQVRHEGADLVLRPDGLDDRPIGHGAPRHLP